MCVVTNHVTTKIDALENKAVYSINVFNILMSLHFTIEIGLFKNKKQSLNCLRNSDER
jgi:hypothetical protein